MISSAKAHHEKTLIQNLTTNPNTLYGYVKSRSKIRASISKLVKSARSLTKHDSEVVKELSGFFIQEDPSSVPEILLRVNSSLNEICIAKEEVYSQLSCLNPNKTTGSDGLHPSLLKKLCCIPYKTTIFAIFSVLVHRRDSK